MSVLVCVHVHVCVFDLILVVCAAAIATAWSPCVGYAEDSLTRMWCDVSQIHARKEELGMDMEDLKHFSLGEMDLINHEPDFFAVRGLHSMRTLAPGVRECVLHMVLCSGTNGARLCPNFAVLLLATAPAGNCELWLKWDCLEHLVDTLTRVPSLFPPPFRCHRLHAGR